MTAAVTLISSVTTAGSQATVTFSSIAATYRDLLVTTRARCDIASPGGDLYVRINGDTAANYDWIDLEQSTTRGKTITLASTVIRVGYIPGISAPANSEDVYHTTFYDYRGTTFQKAVAAKSGVRFAASSGNLYTLMASGWWRNTAAITALQFLLPGTTAFIDGSVLSLYGRM